MPPLVDPWIEQPCCGHPVCVCTAMEQKSTVSCEATEKGSLTVHMPDPQPLRVDFHWVPGSDPGTFDGSPWLLHRFLAQLGDCMSFHFEHCQDNLSRVCEVLGAPDRPTLGVGSPYLDGCPCLMMMSSFARILKRLFKT